MNRKLQDVTSRRNFLKASAVSITAALIGGAMESRQPINILKSGEFPVKVISSGNGLKATKTAYEMIGGEQTFWMESSLASILWKRTREIPRSVLVACPMKLVSCSSIRQSCMVPRIRLAVACIECQNTPPVLPDWFCGGPIMCCWWVRYAPNSPKLMVPRGRLLTDRARQIWLRWKETMSEKDDWLSPPVREKES